MNQSILFHARFGKDIGLTLRHHSLRQACGQLLNAEIGELLGVRLVNRDQVMAHCAIIADALAILGGVVSVMAAHASSS